jgi:hypothetical protein
MQLIASEALSADEVMVKDPLRPRPIFAMNMITQP